MDNEQTDNEIIDSFQDGNIDDFQILVQRYTNVIFNFNARLVGTEEAPDVTQMVFIKAWKNINKFDSQKACFKTWIFTIAKNTSYDFLRKKKTINFNTLEKDNDDFSYSEKIIDEAALPDELTQKMQDKEYLNNIIEQLPKEYKMVLILHYQEEMTFSEISKILNKPLNTVKSYHYRAILKLRKML